LGVRALKLSKYIERLQAFQAEHGDMEVFVPDRTSDIFQERSLIGVKDPHTPVAADFYLVDGNTMVPRPGQAIQKHNRDKYLGGGAIALPAGVPRQ
jgi:hypothetical protein